MSVHLNCVLRADGAPEELPATARVKLDAGDVFEALTPGGGGARKVGMR